MSLDKLFSKLKGGPGSGNWGHGGRPGKRGGSTPKGGGAFRRSIGYNSHASEFSEDQIRSMNKTDRRQLVINNAINTKLEVQRVGMDQYEDFNTGDLLGTTKNLLRAAAQTARTHDRPELGKIYEEGADLNKF